MAKNRNLFRITRFILLKLPFLFRFLAKFRSGKKRLLIIKTDAIGDYVLFRNYLEFVKDSEKFNDYEIDLLGNTIWQDFALQNDAAFIDNFYFTKSYALYDEPLETLKLGWRLFKNNYHTVLLPSFSRILSTDGLAGLTAAKQIIGFESDNEGIVARYKKKTDKFYTNRLILPSEIYFEFERSRFFFQSVLNCRIDMAAPSLQFNKTAREGIVIFPGAGIMKRGWEKEKFLALIRMIIERLPQTIYLAGGPAEKDIGHYLTGNLQSESVNNLIGKTSLAQLVDLIGNANLVIANETSAIHIAVATKTKSVCILGGGHFGRFAPYPAEFENAPVCVLEKMECYNCNWVCKFKTEENEPYPCVGNINFEKVAAAVMPFLLTK